MMSYILFHYQMLIDLQKWLRSALGVFILSLYSYLECNIALKNVLKSRKYQL